MRARSSHDAISISVGMADVFKLTLYGATAPDRMRPIKNALASQVLAGF